MGTTAFLKSLAEHSPGDPGLIATCPLVDFNGNLRLFRLLKANISNHYILKKAN